MTWLWMASAGVRPHFDSLSEGVSVLLKHGTFNSPSVSTHTNLCISNNSLLVGANYVCPKAPVLI